ncbi:hypothetical protein AXG93_812s1090 [Marchantia polymorpha subsp. ruderalis]|uniref:Uncharacterized protein n=1 Tax=Marchantia polymorpha subsp. ruderalis TaxID=1480154 RepID=A0A176VXR1_MARPO|nr:hypothetical protein AXG93_812s1090 [Marchantia polymorpha subsp. ruderalis]
MRTKTHGKKLDIPKFQRGPLHGKQNSFLCLGPVQSSRASRQPGSQAGGQAAAAAAAGGGRAESRSEEAIHAVPPRGSIYCLAHSLLLLLPQLGSFVFPENYQPATLTRSPVAEHWLQQVGVHSGRLTWFHSRLLNPEMGLRSSRKSHDPDPIVRYLGRPAG